MTRKLDDIAANGPLIMSDETKSRDALVAAYNAVEGDTMHGMPHRDAVLAILRAMLVEPGLTETVDAAIF